VAQYGLWDTSGDNSSIHSSARYCINATPGASSRRGDTVCRRRLSPHFVPFFPFACRRSLKPPLGQLRFPSRVLGLYGNVAYVLWSFILHSFNSPPTLQITAPVRPHSFRECSLFFSFPSHIFSSLIAFSNPAHACPVPTTRPLDTEHPPSST